MLFQEIYSPNIVEDDLDTRVNVDGVFCPITRSRCTVECVLFEPTIKHTNEVKEVILEDTADGRYYRWKVQGDGSFIEVKGTCLLREYLISRTTLRSPTFER